MNTSAFGRPRVNGSVAHLLPPLRASPPLRGSIAHFQRNEKKTLG
jgi:hypothetical protein